MKATRMISFLLVAVLLCGVMPLAVSAEESAPYIYSWISDAPFGTDLDEEGVYDNLLTDTTYYFCYELYNSETGVLWDDFTESDYTLELKVSDPNGVVLALDTYTTDQNYTTVTFDEPGEYLVEVEVWGDYSFYGTFSFTILPNPKDNHEPYITWWLSDSALGGDIDEDGEYNDLYVGEMYYFCYEIYDGITGEPWDSVVYNEYFVEMRIYDPDGKVLYSDSFIDDQNYISAVFAKAGTYRIITEISGDLSYSGEYTVEVIDHPDEEFLPYIWQWFSDTPLGADLDGEGHYDQLKIGETYYFCYEIFDDETGALWDDIVSSDYQLSVTVLGPDGNTVKTGTFYNDQNYLAICFDQLGVYRMIIEIGGDYYYYVDWPIEIKNSVLYGDINGDGKINARDYMMLKRYVLNTYDLDTDQLERADINHDGKVNTRDYMMLKRHVLGTYTIQ